MLKLKEILNTLTQKNMIFSAVKIEVYSYTCHVLSIDDLIKSKKAAGRTKDLLMLDELEALKKVKENGL